MPTLCLFPIAHLFFGLRGTSERVSTRSRVLQQPAGLDASFKGLPGARKAVSVCLSLSLFRAVAR